MAALSARWVGGALGLVGLFAMGCGAPKSLQTPVKYAPVEGLPALCTSFVPDAGRFPGREKKAWARVRTALADGRLADAGTAVRPLSNHPARESVLLLQKVLDDGPETYVDEVFALAEVYPDDGCIAQFAATTMMGVDRKRALEAAERAVARLPDDPDAALVHVVLSATSGDDREAATRALMAHADRFPEHGPSQVVAGQASLNLGELEFARTAFQRAFDVGLTDVSEMLFHLRRMTGELGPYLVQAKADGEPVSAVEFTDDPAEAVAALDAWLGIGANEQLEATLETSEGAVHCRLFHREAPVTVINFVALARGQQTWRDPAEGGDTQRALYDGTTFHRVIPDFMIQGGDPLGTGEGFPGYRFRDELHPDLHFDRPGRLAMANSGQDTNGSQFFITEVPVPHLDGLHTIFGQCDDLDVVKSIARVPTGPGDKPESDVTLESIAFAAVPCETCEQ
jgi:cyclophilin family peptidyl-prolyl cis-trans isomerase